MKRKTVYIATPIILAGLLSGVAFLNINQEKPVVKEQAKVEVVEQEVKPVEAPVEEVTQEVVNEPVQVAQAPAVAPEQPTVTILSTQEYANQYLDMTVPRAQQCLDAIVATWPARFAEGVREANIKGLRAFANICTTGMDEPNKQTAIIYRYGANGEFFDSQLAISKH
jgi:hypothetical protein